MRKIIINPLFDELKPFIEDIPQEFQQTGKLVYVARNELKSFEINNIHIIVKSYKKPHFVNRIAYTFFRPSKAERAYKYAQRLLELNIQSPNPIAYIITKKNNLLENSYFISVFEKDYLDIRELTSGEQKDDELLKALGEYIAYFHSKGVLHLDMSPGNILYKKENNEYKFTLVDINRMQFLSEISTKKRFKSFKRLCESPDVLKDLSVYYANAAGLDINEALRKIEQYSYEFFNSRKFKRRQ